ncbi:hypothetical protein HPB50_008665 [Hyalomma asiaticum]|uniref:Uncharacterized protein n=1 Tax=Hyalomma asiaticum TaxID=266040 RepID=A0ACB7TH61_HYAAI|nr:hypothetical protein HPB50_008665 [Hyalomma asiaticum]
MRIFCKPKILKYLYKSEERYCIDFSIACYTVALGLPRTSQCACTLAEARTWPVELLAAHRAYPNADTLHIELQTESRSFSVFDNTIG